jgi:hypothetical protein
MTNLPEQPPQAPKRGVSRRLALMGLGLAGLMAGSKLLPQSLYRKLQTQFPILEDSPKALALSNAPQVVSPNWVLAGNTGTNPATDFLGTTDAEPLVIKTNGTEHVRIAANGNVGIGTPSPFTTLDIVSAGSSNTPQVSITQSNMNDFARLRIHNSFAGEGIEFWDIAAGPATNPQLNFFAASGKAGMPPGNVMTLTADPTLTFGKVGIGTTSPAAVFEVSSGTPSATPQVEITQRTSGDFARLRLNNVNSSGGVPFWDIAAGPNGNPNLNFFAQGSGNIMSLSTGGVSIKGNLSVSGQKHFVQDHPTDPAKEIVYVALEGGEAGTYIRGTGKLVDGKAVIELPEHFSLVTNQEGLTIHLTPRGEWLQLYVVELDTRQSVIREAQGKSGEFDYLIHGVRAGHEHHQVIRAKTQE